jgi:hypothetical protein
VLLKKATEPKTRTKNPETRNKVRVFPCEHTIRDAPDVAPAPEAPPTARHKISGEIDPGIRQAVQRLQEAGIETFESCEGGNGHSYPEPTVAFLGGPDAGWRALSACLAYRLPVMSLRRVWDFYEPNEPIGPHWEITFRRRML